jgi:hypothetical protein
MAAPNPPATLLFFEAPLQVGEGASIDAASAKRGKSSAPDLEDVINSILPPRCVLNNYIRSSYACIDHKLLRSRLI